MGYGLSTVSAPAAEPVSVAEAKAHLRVETSDDDTYIETLIAAAREYVEQYLGRALITQTLKLTLDGFPGADGVIRLPRGPVQSISSITYLDDQGDSQTLDAADYRVDTESLEARITPAYSETWPTTYPVTNAVSITFVAGYGDAAANVPAPIKHAIKLLLGTYYDAVRETVSVGSMPFPMPHAAEWLLGPYRIVSAPGTLT